MSDLTKRLVERRVTLVKQAQEVAERAVTESRDMSAEENQQFDKLMGEVDGLAERISQLDEGDKRSRDIDQMVDSVVGKRDAEGATLSKESAELRSFLRGEAGAPRHFDVKPQGIVDYRALSKLTAGAGLNTVPTSFYDRLMAHLIEVNALIRSGATVLNTNSGENLQIPKTTAHSTAAIVTEAGTIGTSEPTFGQVTLGAFKYGALIQVSRELLTDTGVDLEGYLAMQAGRALGNASGAHFVTGTGTTQPFGIVVGASSGVVGGAGVAGAFTSDNIIDLYYSVIAPYRNSSSCGWLLKDSTVGFLRKLKDTTGQYLWQPGMQVGAPDMLLGKPVYTDPSVAAVALSAKSVVFGDLSQYFIRIAGGVRFERSDDFAFNTDLVTYRALLRADGVLVDQTGAVKYFIGNAA